MGTTNLDALELSGALSTTAITADSLTLGGQAVAELVVAEVTVDASAGGTAEETAIVTVPADSWILDVIAIVDVAFNGDTTQTFEVGLTGNVDKYIDTSDFDPSATAGTQASSNGGTTNDQKTSTFVTSTEAIVATWTNTANMTAGSVTVRVAYIALA